MRTTIVLAAVAVLLGAYILLVERHRPTSDEKRADRVRLLPRFDRSGVRQIAFTDRAGNTFTVQRHPEIGDRVWHLSPDDKPGNDVAIEQVLTELDSAETDRDADLGLAEAGLRPPLNRVELQSVGGATAKLAIGRDDAAGKGAFVEVNGDGRVRVASRSLADLLRRDVGAYQDRRVLPAALFSASSLALGWSEAGGPTESLSKVGGRFRNERGEWVGEERVAEALRRLTALRFERFVDAPAAPPAPARTLEAGAGVGERWSVRLRAGGCASAAEVLADRAGPGVAEWGCLPAQAVDDAFRALRAAHARFERILVSAPDLITSVELGAGRRSLVLSRTSTGARWTFAAPAVPYAVDAGAVDEWLAALGGVRLDFTPGGQGAAARTLRVISPGLDEKTTVFASSGAGKEGTVAVLRAGEPTAARAPSTLLALLDPDPLRFRDRKVLDTARFDAQRLRVSSGGRTVDLSKSEDQSWHVTAPAGAALDTAALDRLLATLTNLRAERYLPPDTKLAVDRALTLTEKPPGADAPTDHVVQLSARRSDGCTGKISDAGGRATFALPPAACDALGAAVIR